MAGNKPTRVAGNSGKRGNGATSNGATSNSVRILGGIWRGRRLPFPDVPGLRPTPDRVRETLFNWLGQRLTGLRCLDLFAGSGALGLEAASRGAAEVTLIEADARAFAALQGHCRTLEASQVRLIRADALAWLKTHADTDPLGYDLIFLDPPFGTGLLATSLQLVAPWLRPGGTIYAEFDVPPDLSAWEVWREGRAGQTRQVLLRRPDKVA